VQEIVWEGKLGNERIKCPKCDRWMDADLNDPAGFMGKLEYDNWVCCYCFGDCMVKRVGKEQKFEWF